MKHLTIAGVHKPLSNLVLGSGGLVPENMDFVERMLGAFLEHGGNTVDLAYIYNGGGAEKAIGQWLASNPRDLLNVWTKGAHPDENGSRVDPAAIAEELEISLDRLQTEYVDLYALHRDDLAVPVGELVDALHEHIDAGRIRAIGVSNWTTARIDEANAYADANGLTGFVFNSPNFSLAKANEPYWPGCVSAGEDTVRWHERTGMPLLSWSSQAGGFFSGRFSPDDRSNDDIVRVFYSEGNWERLRRARELADELGVAPIQLSLAYVLTQTFPTAAIVGPATLEELDSCVRATEIELTPEQIAWLDLGRDDRG